MHIEKVDAATELLEDARNLVAKMKSANDSVLKSRELSIAITNIETGKLWLLELAAQVQNA